MLRLGEDGHGVWLGAPAGTVIQRGHEPGISIAHDFVQLIPRRHWWVAIFNGSDHRLPVYVDVTTEPDWVGPSLVEMVDLDLDVVRRQDGSVYVDDEDEFEEHRLTLGYDPRTVDTARATAARLVLEVERGEPPFDDTSAAWLTLLRDG